MSQNQVCDCPKCNRIDFVKKVPVIVKDGRKTTYAQKTVPVLHSDPVYSGRYNDIVSFDVYQTLETVTDTKSEYTALATNLLFPNEPLWQVLIQTAPPPEYPKEPPLADSTAWMVGIGIGFAVIICLMIGSFSDFIFFIIYGLIPGWVIGKVIKNLSKNDLPHRQYREAYAKAQEESKVWRQVNDDFGRPLREIYAQLLYCGRCGCVYFPGIQLSCEPNKNSIANLLLRLKPIIYREQDQIALKQ